MKTKAIRKSEAIKNRQWYIVDAKGIRLGRLASEVAQLLIGKSKTTFAPNLDSGDYVVVINAEKISVHPRKLKRKIYYRHSGYIGSLKEEILEKLLARKPEEVIIRAVKGMLPKTKLQKLMLKRLYVYNTDAHPHEAQKPIKFNIE